MKTAVLLIDMGGPRTPEEYKTFLIRMFSDRHIIPAPFFVRFFLARYIAARRRTKGWMNYETIGGTPIREGTKRFGQLLKEKLLKTELIKKEFFVDTAFSYSEPFIGNKVQELRQKGVKKILALPLYPQKSFTTTESVREDLQKATQKRGLEFVQMDSFFDHPCFTEFWGEQLNVQWKISNQTTLSQDASNQNPEHLVFSAHSLPCSIVNKFQDPYPKQVGDCASSIAARLDLDFSVCYQSQLNKEKWLGPSTEDCLRELYQKGLRNIALISISFLNENLETLFDLDHKLIPRLKKELPDLNLQRIKIPESSEALSPLIKLFSEFVKSGL